MTGSEEALDREPPPYTKPFIPAHRLFLIHPIKTLRKNIPYRFTQIIGISFRGNDPSFFFNFSRNTTFMDS
jgi:hypothetical protein